MECTLSHIFQQAVVYHISGKTARGPPPRSARVSGKRGGASFWTSPYPSFARQRASSNTSLGRQQSRVLGMQFPFPSVSQGDPTKALQVFFPGKTEIFRSVKPLLKFCFQLAAQIGGVRIIDPVVDTGRPGCRKAASRRLWPTGCMCSGGCRGRAIPANPAGGLHPPISSPQVLLRSWSFSASLGFPGFPPSLQESSSGPSGR